MPARRAPLGRGPPAPPTWWRAVRAWTVFTALGDLLYSGRSTLGWIVSWCVWAGVRAAQTAADWCWFFGAPAWYSIASCAVRSVLAVCGVVEYTMLSRDHSLDHLFPHLVDETAWDIQASGVSGTPAHGTGAASHRSGTPGTASPFPLPNTPTSHAPPHPGAGGGGGGGGVPCTAVVLLLSTPGTPSTGQWYDWLRQALPGAHVYQPNWTHYHQWLNDPGVQQWMVAMRRATSPTRTLHALVHSTLQLDPVDELMDAYGQPLWAAAYLHDDARHALWTDLEDILQLIRTNAGEHLFRDHKPVPFLVFAHGPMGAIAYDYFMEVQQSHVQMRPRGTATSAAGLGALRASRGGRSNTNHPHSQEDTSAAGCGAGNLSSRHRAAQGNKVRFPYVDGWISVAVPYHMYSRWYGRSDDLPRFVRPLERVWPPGPVLRDVSNNDGADNGGQSEDEWQDVQGWDTVVPHIVNVWSNYDPFSCRVQPLWTRTRGVLDVRMLYGLPGLRFTTLAHTTCSVDQRVRELLRKAMWNMLVHGTSPALSRTAHWADDDDA